MWDCMYMKMRKLWEWMWKWDTRKEMIELMLYESIVGKMVECVVVYQL